MFYLVFHIIMSESTLCQLYGILHEKVLTMPVWYTNKIKYFVLMRINCFAYIYFALPHGMKSAYIVHGHNLFFICGSDPDAVHSLPLRLIISFFV
uniref:Uncharacterized protein n=1 Tax=Rhizophora mucronata TaxID=61149 RepID=A0A2P2LLI6_RHIMU